MRICPPWQDVFDEIAAAGFRYTELGPLGYLPKDSARIKDELDKRNLRAVGAALLAPMADARAGQTTLSEARDLLTLIAGSGGTFLVIVDWTLERQQTAGRPVEARRLKGRGRQDFFDLFEEVGRISRTEFNVQALAHPHAGSFLEFEDEIEELLALTDPNLVQLAVDTGHSVYAGVDPAALFARHAQRTPYVNLKDVTPEGLQRVKNTRGLPFLEAVDQGVFCPLGKGSVNFERFCAALQDHDFCGPAVIEQDREPSGFSGALTEMRASLEFLRAFGLSTA